MPSRMIFGRYWASGSVLHKLDPRTKLVGTLIMVVSLFVAQTPVALGFVAFCTFAMFRIAKIPPVEALRSIAPLLFIVLVTAIFNIAFVHDGAPLLDWGWLVVTSGGVYRAAFVSVRLIMLLLLGSLLTLTTTTMDITEATEYILSPLAKVKIPVHEFAFVMGTALRFLPQFVDEFHSIRDAQLSRGAGFSTSPSRGLAAIASLIVPLFSSAFRHADTLSEAMEARCYHGPDGRSRLHPLRFSKKDAAAAAVLCGILAAASLLSLM